MPRTMRVEYPGAIYMSQIPIPAAPPTERAALEALVDRILKAKRADPAADVSAQERFAVNAKWQGRHY